MPGKWFLEECEPCWIPPWISVHCAATNLLHWLHWICRALHSKHWEHFYWQVQWIILKDYFIVQLSKAVWLIRTLENALVFQWHKTSRPPLIVLLLTLCFLCIHWRSSHFLFFGFSVWIPLFNRDDWFPLTSSANALPGGFTLPHTHTHTHTQMNTQTQVVSIPWRECRANKLGHNDSSFLFIFT